MKTNRSPSEAHRDQVNNLIDEHRAEWTQQELERIRRDGDGVGQPDSTLG